MIIDVEKIKKLLESNVSGDRIESCTGVGKKTIWNYRNGKAKLKNMTIGNAHKLCEFWEEKKGEEKMNIKITGIKSAVGDFNNWQGAARVYFDTLALKVWTNVYDGPGQWDDYHDANVVEILSKATNNMLERDDKTSMYQLKKLCAEWLEKKYDEENPKQYWVNENSGLVLTQEAYDELVLREAKNIWDDPQDDAHDDYDNFETFLKSTYESEDDFVPSDKNGKILQAEEW